MLGAAKYLKRHLAALDPAWVDGRIAAIEPIERRAGWSALRDGTYTESRVKRSRMGSRHPCRAIEKALERGPWLAGPAFSVADIDAYPMLCVLPDFLLQPSTRRRPRASRSTSAVSRHANRCVRRCVARARRHPERQFVPGVEAARWG